MFYLEWSSSEVKLLPSITLFVNPRKPFLSSERTLKIWKEAFFLQYDKSHYAGDLLSGKKYTNLEIQWNSTVSPHLLPIKQEKFLYIIYLCIHTRTRSHIHKYKRFGHDLAYTGRIKNTITNGAGRFLKPKQEH